MRFKYFEDNLIIDTLTKDYYYGNIKTCNLLNKLFQEDKEEFDKLKNNYKKCETFKKEYSKILEKHNINNPNELDVILKKINKERFKNFYGKRR